MVKAVIIISTIILVILYLAHRLKILNDYKKKYTEILISAAYKAQYDNPGDCPSGYRLPTLKEFEMFYNEDEFDSTHKFIKDDSIISNEV